MAPYIRMHKRATSPRSSILFTATSTPLLSTFKALRHRYFFTSAITLVALLAEALNIVIAGVPYATGETWLQFLRDLTPSVAVTSCAACIASYLPVRAGDLCTGEPSLGRRIAAHPTKRELAAQSCCGAPWICGRG